MRDGLSTIAGLAVAAMIIVSCGGQSPSSPVAATSSPGTSPQAGAFALRPAPVDLGCDAMGVPYRSVTFEIDPAAADPVTAVTDGGASLATYWSAGFVGDAAADPVVRDPAGQVIAADGEALPIPEGAWPRLHGYFVCPSADALYVLLQDPA